LQPFCSCCLQPFLTLAANPADDVKKADQDWAKAAGSKNVDQFMSFVDDDVYGYGFDGKWIHGKQAMRDVWSKMLADPNFKLNWTVESADLSKDMGYTRGTFPAPWAISPRPAATPRSGRKINLENGAVVDMATSASRQ
jgi:hypothetical protein